MIVLGPVDEPAADFSTAFVTRIFHFCRMGFEPVGDGRLNLSMAPECLLYRGQSRRLVALSGNEAPEDFAFVINRAPRVSNLAVGLDVQLIEASAPLPNALHSDDPSLADVSGE